MLLCSVVKELVRHDTTAINDEDEDSNTPLHLAALTGHNKVALVLLEEGADIEARYLSPLVSVILSPPIGILLLILYKRTQ